MRGDSSEQAFVSVSHRGFGPRFALLSIHATQYRRVVLQKLFPELAGACSLTPELSHHSAQEVAQHQVVANVLEDCVG